MRKQQGSSGSKARGAQGTELMRLLSSSLIGMDVQNRIMLPNHLEILPGTATASSGRLIP